MDVLTAHAILAAQQDAMRVDGWPDVDPADPTAPLFLIGLAVVSGGLDDAADEAGLLAAVQHGESLVLSGVVSPEEVDLATAETFELLQAFAERFGPQHEN